MVILDKKTFSQLLKNPREITLEESLSIKKITKQYPFFQTASWPGESVGCNVPVFVWLSVHQKERNIIIYHAHI